MDETSRLRLDRRSVLKLGAAGAAGAGLAAVGLQTPAVADGSLTSPLSQIPNDTNPSIPYVTYYNGSPTSFQYDTTLYGRMRAWVAFHWANHGHLPNGPWGGPVQLHLLGTHVHSTLPSGGPSLHWYGRAVDFRGIWARHTTNNSTIEVWHTNNRDDAIYWAHVASLEGFFADVLHRHYTGHVDHVHIDNGISGGGNSNFNTGSPVQVKFVQAALTRVWGISTSVDGGYGPQTINNSRTVLARIGRDGYLTTSQQNWFEFCKATFRKGTGKQAY